MSCLRSLKERPAPFDDHPDVTQETQIRTNTPLGGPPRGIWAGKSLLSPCEREFLVRLGDGLRTMRAVRDMSRRELANRSGVSERYIAQIEAGKGNVSIVLLLRIAREIRTE